MQILHVYTADGTYLGEATGLKVWEKLIKAGVFIEIIRINEKKGEAIGRRVT